MTPFQHVLAKVAYECALAAQEDAIKRGCTQDIAAYGQRVSAALHRLMRAEAEEIRSYAGRGRGDGQEI